MVFGTEKCFLQACLLKSMGGLDFMRSMALASAPVCSLLLVLKLSNCSLLVLLVAENWLHGLRFVWVRATHILVAKWCVSYLCPCR